jgi:hypothetical protein
MQRFLVTLLIGLAPLLEVQAQLFVPGNLVVNPGFESGFSGWTGTYGLVNPPGGSYEGLTAGVIIQAQGTQNLQVLQQAIPTVVGDMYEIQFSLLAGNGLVGDPSPGHATINVFWGGLLGLSIGQFSNPSTTQWETFDAVVTATSTSTTLEFFDPADQHLQLVDAVSVAEVPEPRLGLLIPIGLGLLAFKSLFEKSVIACRDVRA